MTRVRGQRLQELGGVLATDPQLVPPEHVLQEMLLLWSKWAPAGQAGGDAADGSAGGAGAEEEEALQQHDEGKRM